jgi:autonomous glycyl radical cofactor GrcA
MTDLSPCMQECIDKIDMLSALIFAKSEEVNAEFFIVQVESAKALALKVAYRDVISSLIPNLADDYTSTITKMRDYSLRFSEAIQLQQRKVVESITRVVKFNQELIDLRRQRRLTKMQTRRPTSKPRLPSSSAPLLKRLP